MNLGLTSEPRAYYNGHILSQREVADGRIVGCILYSRSRVESVDTVTFGPLCMEPEWQGRGVGKALLDATLPLAREAGYPGVVIFGEPDYYPLHGFKTCDKFGITTPDGRNFPAFMAYELREGALADVHGRFFEAELFEHFGEIAAAELAAFDADFEPLEKQRFPGQWDGWAVIGLDKAC